MPEVDKSILEQYVATANSGKYKSLDEVNAKFPELKGYDHALLEQYVATANSGKYKSLDEVNTKFPEFFSPGVEKKNLVGTTSKDISQLSAVGGVSTPQSPSQLPSVNPDSFLGDAINGNGQQPRQVAATLPQKPYSVNGDKGTYDQEKANKQEIETKLADTKKHKQEALENTVTKVLNAQGKSLSVANKTSALLDLQKKINNGDAAIVKGDDGKYAYGRVPTWHEEIAKSLYNTAQGIGDTFDLYTTDPLGYHPEEVVKKIKDIDERKQREAHTKFNLTDVLMDAADPYSSSHGKSYVMDAINKADLSQPQNAEAGIGGKAAGFVASIAPDLAVATATGGASIPAQVAIRSTYFQAKGMGETAMDLYHRKVKELTEQGVPQEQAELEAAKGLKENAALSQVPNTIMQTYLFAEPLKTPALTKFSDVISHAAGKTAKMTGLAGLQEGATQGIEASQGYKPELAKVGENMKQFATLEALFGAIGIAKYTIGNVPKFVKAYAKEAAVQPEIAPLITEQLKDDPNGAAIAQELNQYASDTAPVRDMLGDKMNASIGGRVELINKLKGKIEAAEAQKKTLPDALHKNIDETIAAHQEQIAKANKDIERLQKTDDPLKVEHDDVSGEPIVQESSVPTNKTIEPATKVEPKQEGSGVGEDMKSKSDVDIEKRMAELEDKHNGIPSSFKDEVDAKEYHVLEKEMENRERDSVFNVPLSEVNNAVDVLMKKEKDMPNGFGSFIERRDANETRNVANRYLDAKSLTDAGLKKDFKDALFGNPTTWYADGLKLREAMNEAAKRGIGIEDLLKTVEDQFTKEGFDEETARETIAGMLKPVFEGSQKVETDLSKQLPNDTTTTKNTTTKQPEDNSTAVQGSGAKAKPISAAGEPTEPTAELGQEGKPKEVKPSKTLSGLTEEERLAQVAERSKESNVSAKIAAENELINLANKFIEQRKSKDYRGSEDTKRIIDAKAKEAGYTTQVISGKTQSIGFKKDGLWVKLKKQNIGDKNISITNDETALLGNREKGVGDIFKDLYDNGAENIYVKDIYGRKMTEGQVKQAISDVRDGIPSQGAKAYLDAIEQIHDTGHVDFGKEQAIFGTPTLKEHLDAHNPDGYEPMPKAEFNKWLDEESNAEDLHDIETAIHDTRQSENPRSEPVQQPKPKPTANGDEQGKPTTKSEDGNADIKGNDAKSPNGESTNSTNSTDTQQSDGGKQSDSTKDLGTWARKKAEKVRKGEANVLPSWLRADLGEDVNTNGISINDAYAKALETFADVHDATKDFAQAVKEGVQHLKDWYDENGVKYNGKELTDNFSKHLEEQGIAEEKTTSVKNAIKEEERNARGLDEVPSHDKRGREERFKATAERIKNGEIDARSVSTILAKNPKSPVFDKSGNPLSLEEIQNTLVHDAMDISNDYDKTIQILSDTETYNDDGKTVFALEQKKALEEALEANDKASRSTGTELSAGFIARQNIINQRYNLVNVVKAFKAASKGKDVPPHVEKMLADLTSELKKAKDELETYAKERDAAILEVERIKEERSKIDEEHTIETVKETVKRRNTADKTFRSQDKIRNDIKRKKDNFLAKWNKLAKGGDVVTAVPIPGAAQLKLLTEYAAETLYHYVELGASNIEDVMANIREDLGDRINNISDKTLRDVISGYSKISKNGDPIIKKLNQIKSEGRLVSAIEQAEKGENPLKSGGQRDKPSDLLRGLRRDLDDAMKRMGIRATDAEKHLKSALDKAEERMKNRIADLQNAIDTETKLPQRESGIEYDERTKQVKAELDKVKKQYDDTFKTDKELTDEERLSRAIKSTGKTIDDYDARIAAYKSGDKATAFAKNESNTPNDAALKIWQNLRDERAKEFKQLKDDEGITYQEKLKAYKSSIDTRIKKLQEKLDNNDFKKAQKKVLQLDEEALAKKANYQRVKNKLDAIIRKQEQANRPFLQKLADALAHWKREAVVFNLTSIPKLGLAGAGSVLRKIPEELIAGPIWHAILPRYITDAAISESGSFKTNAQAVGKGFAAYGKTWKDFGKSIFGKDKESQQMKILKDGKDDLDTVHDAGKRQEDELFSLYAGRLHGVLKEPTKQASFALNMDRMATNLSKLGEDISSDANKRMMTDIAYLNAKGDILTNKNLASSTYRTVLSQLENSKLGKFGGKAAAFIAKNELPIVTVPTNFVNEILKYNYGAVHASAKGLEVLYNKVFNGTDITQKQADYIVRALKKQSVGAAIYITGMLLHSQIAGYDEKSNKKKGLKKGQVEFLGGTIPAWAFHNPVLEPLLMGATMADVYKEHGSVGKGLWEGTMGAIKEVPFISTPENLLRSIKSPNGMAKHLGELVGSFIPGLSTEIAKYFDKTTDDNVKRKPDGFWDEIFLRVPGLRQKVKTDLQNYMDKRRVSHLEKTDEQIEEKVQKKEDRVTNEQEREELCIKLGIEYEPTK